MFLLLFCRQQYVQFYRQYFMNKWYKLVVSVPTDTYKYCTLHCTGYMRSWPSSQLDSESDAEKETSSLTCLVTVCRLLTHVSHQPSKDINVKPSEFVTRCAIDGKFTFVEQQWVSRFLTPSICTSNRLSSCLESWVCSEHVAPLRKKWQSCGEEASDRVLSVRLSVEIILSVFAIVSQKDLCVLMASHENLFSCVGK